MATVVQTAVGSFSGTSAVATFGSAVTAGNAIIVLRTSFEADESGSARTYTITDNQGGANGDYVAIGSQYTDPVFSPLWTHQVRGLANSAGGSGTAVTVTASEDEAGSIIVAEISGLGTSLTVDGAQVNTSGSGTTVAGSSKSATAAGIHIVLATLITGVSRTFTAGSGWTQAAQDAGENITLALWHRAAANGVSQSAAGTISGAIDGWSTLHVVLSDDEGGGGGEFQAAWARGSNVLIQ